MGSAREGTEWFEPLYAGAAGEVAAVPWARAAPEPLLLAWLEHVEVAGSDVLVVGCGLGDDAIELARRGARVRAFDLAPTAVAWARRRAVQAGVEVDLLVADLLELPDDLRAAAGLVVEVRTVQSLPEELRADAMRAIAATVAPGGLLVHVGLVATSPRAARTAQGPPWPLEPDELRTYEAAGLERVDLVHPPQEAAGDTMDVVLTMQRADPAPGT